jgi:ubiquinone/menaquinone biosynthesis C-methylase UbiE
MTDHIIDEGMRSYYEQRAVEYDDWWLGTGLFRERERLGWDAEVGELVQLLESLEPARVLDVACGTGFLTRHLRGDVTAIDQSPSMAEIASARLPQARVMVADAVPLPFADGEFERVFTSHFYGHLLERERTVFLREGRRVASAFLVVDSALRPGVEPEERQQRMLNDGSYHEVYKRYFTGPGLAEELGGGEVLHAGHWFVVAG